MPVTRCTGGPGAKRRSGATGVKLCRCNTCLCAGRNVTSVTLTFTGITVDPGLTTLTGLTAADFNQTFTFTNGDSLYGGITFSTCGTAAVYPLHGDDSTGYPWVAELWIFAESGSSIAISVFYPGGGPGGMTFIGGIFGSAVRTPGCVAGTWANTKTGTPLANSGANGSVTVSYT